MMKETTRYIKMISSDLRFDNQSNPNRGATGLPLGVQVIGLPWQEETVLHCMKEIEESIKEKPDFREIEEMKDESPMVNGNGIVQG